MEQKSLAQNKSYDQNSFKKFLSWMTPLSSSQIKVGHFNLEEILSGTASSIDASRWYAPVPIVHSLSSFSEKFEKQKPIKSNQSLSLHSNLKPNNCFNGFVNKEKDIVNWDKTNRSAFSKHKTIDPIYQDQNKINSKKRLLKFIFDTKIKKVSFSDIL